MSGGEFEARSATWRKQFRRDQKLSAATKVVLSVIADEFLNREAFNAAGKLVAWPGIRLLIRETGISNATVQKALKEAVRLGYLKIERRGERRKDGTFVTNHYLAGFPRQAKQPVIAPVIPPVIDGYHEPSETNLLKLNTRASLAPPSAAEREERKGWPKESGACSPTFPFKDAVPCGRGRKEGDHPRSPTIPSSAVPLAPTGEGCAAKRKLSWTPGVSTIDGNPRKPKVGVWGAKP
jgi:hypothetical protein